MRKLGWNRLIVLGPAGIRRYPIRARHSELSILSSLDDAPGPPSRELVDFGIETAHGALDIDLTDLQSRSAAAQSYMSLFPGEHYRLLASIVKTLQPEQVVE